MCVKEDILGMVLLLDEDKDNEEIGPEPNKFPCFVGEQIVDYSDDDQALLTPVFLYFEDIEKMLEDLS